jgi:hypothetical protein
MSSEMGKTRAAQAHAIQHQPRTAEDCHLNAVPSRCSLKVPSSYKRLFRGSSRASSFAPVAQHYTNGGTPRTGARFVRKGRRCRCPKLHLLHTAPGCLQAATTRLFRGLLHSLILRGDMCASADELERALHAGCVRLLSAPFTRSQASFQIQPEGPWHLAWRSAFWGSQCNSGAPVSRLDRPKLSPEHASRKQVPLETSQLSPARTLRHSRAAA